MFFRQARQSIVYLSRFSMARIEQSQLPPVMPELRALCIPDTVRWMDLPVYADFSELSSRERLQIERITAGISDGDKENFTKDTEYVRGCIGRQRFLEGLDFVNEKLVALTGGGATLRETAVKIALLNMKGQLLAEFAMRQKHSSQGAPRLFFSAAHSIIQANLIMDSIPIYDGTLIGKCFSDAGMLRLADLVCRKVGFAGGVSMHGEVRTNMPFLNEVEEGVMSFFSLSLVLPGRKKQMQILLANGGYVNYAK